MTRRFLPAVVLVLALPLAGCAGKDPGATASSSSSSPASSSSAGETSNAAPRSDSGQHIEVEVTGGQVSGDTGRVPVPAGTSVTLTVTSDVADEVHVHGYDLEAQLTPGTPTEITFDATVPGVFEVELHDAGTLLLTLQVS